LGDQFKNFTVNYGMERLKVKRAELEMLKLLAANGQPRGEEEMAALRASIDEIVAALKKAGVKKV